MELTVYYVQFISPTVLPFLKLRIFEPNNTDHCLVEYFFGFGVQHCDEILSRRITTNNNNNSAHGKHTCRHKNTNTHMTHTPGIGAHGPVINLNVFSLWLLLLLLHLISVTLLTYGSLFHLQSVAVCYEQQQQQHCPQLKRSNDHMGSQTSSLIPQIIRLFFMFIIIFFCR